MGGGELQKVEVSWKGGMCALRAGEGGGEEGGVPVRPLHAGHRGEEEAMQQAGRAVPETAGIILLVTNTVNTVYLPSQLELLPQQYRA